MENKDIFDKIMGLPVLKLFWPFYEKNKSMLLYLFFGAVTTAVSFISFWLFDRALGSEWVLVSNVLSWILAVFVAFVTNRIWVFQARTEGKKAYFIQMFQFALSRVATLLIESGILLVFVTWLHSNALIVKICTSVIVVILNYVFSKLFVFRKKAEK